MSPIIKAIVVDENDIWKPESTYGGGYTEECLGRMIELADKSRGVVVQKGLCRYNLLKYPSGEEMSVDYARISNLVHHVNFLLTGKNDISRAISPLVVPAPKGQLSFLF